MNRKYPINPWKYWRAWQIVYLAQNNQSLGFTPYVFQNYINQRIHGESEKYGLIQNSVFSKLKKFKHTGYHHKFWSFDSNIYLFRKRTQYV